MNNTSEKTQTADSIIPASPTYYGSAEPIRKTGTASTVSAEGKPPNGK